MSIVTTQHDEESSIDDKREISNAEIISLTSLQHSLSTQTSPHELPTEDGNDEEDSDEAEDSREVEESDELQQNAGTESSVLTRDEGTEDFVPSDPNCDPSNRRARLVIERLDNRQLIELLGPVRSRLISFDTILPMRMQT